MEKILGKKASLRLLSYSALRILANGLDFLGIIGIAILASAFGSFANGGGQADAIDLPVVGKFSIGETEAIALGSAVLLIFVAKSVFSIFLNLKTALYIAGLESQLSVKLSNEFFLAPDVGSPGKTSVSDFQNIVVQSTGGIRTYLNARIQFLAEGSLLLGLLVVFLIVNPIAALFITGFMASVLVLLNRIINNRLDRSGTNFMDGSRVALQTARDLHGINREAQAAGVIDVWIERLARGRTKMARSSAITFTLNSLPRFVIETSLMLGIFFFIGGVVVFSDIPSQAITIGVFLAGGLRVIASVLPLQGALTGMRTGAATGQFALEMIEKIPSHSGAAKTRRARKPKQHSTLRFENVSFTYDSAAKPAVKDVSFEIQPLTKVAIVGPSGSGKSTVMALAAGFLLPDEGRVTLGTKMSRDVLNGHPGMFALVPQRPNLILGSLAENVSLVEHDKANLESVKSALIKAGLHHLTTSKNWASMQLKPDSGHLSGGEIQRISLARALYCNPSYLFLDEATSALDAETEQQITRILEVLKNEMTIFVVAHRLSTIKDADKILYLDEGVLVAEGTFHQLKISVSGFAAAIAMMDLEDTA